MDALYAAVIRDHHKSPRNLGGLPSPPAWRGVGDNPLCGDHVELFVEATEGRVVRAAFIGDGCAISQAIASLLTEAVAGRSVADVGELIDLARRALAGDVPAEAARRELGDLGALTGVAAFPARHRCAALALDALEAAVAPQLGGSAGPPG